MLDSGELSWLTLACKTDGVYQNGFGEDAPRRTDIQLSSMRLGPAQTSKFRPLPRFELERSGWSTNSTAQGVVLSPCGS